MKKALAIILMISGLAPLAIGIIALSPAHPKLLEVLAVQHNHEIYPLVVVIGGAMFPLAIIQYIAAYWILKNNWTGVQFARIIGIMTILGGIMMNMMLQSTIDMVDIIKGAIILIVAMLVKKEQMG